MSATVELTCMILFHAGCDRSPYPEKCLCYICDHDLADYTIRCPDTSLCLYNGARSPENDCVDRLSRFAVIVIG
jgi:hypothetical protein